MPIFTQLFINTTNNELSDDKKSKSQQLLHSIYQGSPVYYADQTDFDLSKKQLLELLNYIVALDPVKLELFSKYRERVIHLSNSFSFIDITVTLKAAKQSLEESLLEIERNHSKVDKINLDDHVVNLCYTGAYSNIVHALSYFQMSSLSTFISAGKYQLLLELAKKFSLHHQLVEYEGNGIHYVNTLYNFVAPMVRLKRLQDALAVEFSAEVLQLFTTYCEEEFNVANFMQVLKYLLPGPPLVAIQYKQQFLQLDDFLSVMGENGAVRETYLKLYQEEYDSTTNLSLVPRPHFAIFYSCFLAELLEKRGYLQGAYQKIDDYSFLCDGKTVIGVNHEGTYRLLSNYELSLFFINQPLKIALLLLPQFPAEILLERYRCEPPEGNQNYFFNALLAKPKLPELVLQNLWKELCLQADNEETQTSKMHLIAYIFSRHFALPSKFIDSLTKELDKEEQHRYLMEWIKSDRSNYIHSLLVQDPDFLAKVQEKLPFQAVEAGAVHTLSVLNELAINLHVMDNNQFSLATAAVRTGQVKSLQKLFALHVPLDNADDKGVTLAHLAASLGQAAILEKLYDLKIPINLQDEKGRTPGHYAARSGQLLCIKKLFELEPESLYLKDHSGWNLSHFAAIHGHIEVIDLLVEFKLFLNQPDKEGHYPLHYAIYNGKSEVIKKFKALHLPLNILDKEGATLAHYAAKSGQALILETLYTLKEPLNKKDKEGATPAHYAARSGRVAILEMLYKLKGTYLRDTDNVGWTVAHYAASNGKVEVIRKLIDLKLFTQIENHGPYTPAQIATRNGQIDVIKLLYRMNKLPDHPAKTNGYTLGHLAVASGNINLVKLLHQLRIALNKPDQNGFSPIHYAVEIGDIKMVETLYELGLPMDTKASISELTPSHCAAAAGHLAIIELFLKLGVPLNIKNREGLTSADLARMNGHKKIFDKLKQSQVSSSWRSIRFFTLGQKIINSAHQQPQHKIVLS